ncbi:MAG: hypothetical protein ACREE0_16070 [Phenylobacterium sp.]
MPNGISLPTQANPIVQAEMACEGSPSIAISPARAELLEAKAAMAALTASVRIFLLITPSPKGRNYIGI